MASLSIEKSPDVFMIHNGNHKLQLKKKGNHILFSFYNDKISLKECTSSILLKEKEKIIPLLPFLSESQDLSVDVANFEDEFGSGKKCQLKCTFQSDPHPSKIELPARWVFHFYFTRKPGIRLVSDPSFFTIQVFLDFIPKTHENLHIYGYAPIYSKSHGFLHLDNHTSIGRNDSITFYSNGWQSWSNSYLLKHSDKWPSSPVKLGRTNMENQDPDLKGRYQSEWHTVITDEKSHSSLVLGFITLKDQFSRILMDRLVKENQIPWLCAVSQTDSLLLKDLNEGLRRSERLMISLVPESEAYEVLTEICRIGGILAKKPNVTKILTGWCSWYYYYTKVTENDMLKNLQYFKQHPDLPIDLIQLDDGYQTAIGDWGVFNEKFNEKFPHGLKWLAEKIKAAKFNSGLWIAPFFMTKKSDFFLKHEDWILTDTKGKKLLTATNWNASQYAIDLSRPEVLKHITETTQVISEKWNFDFLKIDFLYAPEVYSAEYKYQKYSRAQILRNGIQAVRDGFGATKTILGCGCPLGPAVGLVEVMRISTDTAASWFEKELLFYNLGKVSMPALKASLRSTIQRSYMHNTWWVNDPDCMVVRENRSKLTLAEVQFQLTIFGLSGGQVLISDDEELVRSERMDMLKLLLPVYSQSLTVKSTNEGSESEKKEFIPEAIPLDIFTKHLPETYAKTITTSYGTRHLVAIINWKRKDVDATIPISKCLPLAELKKYHDSQNFIVFDFWEEVVLGTYKLSDHIIFQNIATHGCRYISIIPMPEELKDPLFLSSTLHICQGAYELGEITQKENNVSLKVSIPGTRSGNLYFWTPSHWKLTSSTNTVSERNVAGGKITKMHLYVEDTCKVEYKYSKIEIGEKE